MKQISKILLAITVAGLLITSCNNNSATDRDTEEDSVAIFDIAAIKQIIQENNDAFMKAHITRDTALF